MNRLDYRRTMPRNRKILVFHLPTRRRSWWRLASLGLGLLALAILRWHYLWPSTQAADMLEVVAVVFIVSPICYTVSQWWLRRQRVEEI